MRIAGVDEAGRGAVIGPLVVAGVAVQEEKQDLLKKLGVRDSKLLSPKRRESLAKKIETIADQIVLISLSPCRIDNGRGDGHNLNRLEVEKFADVINLLKPEKAIVDAVDVQESRFAALIRAQLSEPLKKIDIVSEHKADTNHVIVGAASIIAKVARDQAIEEIKKKYGDVGPGYSSNEITIAWLKRWYAEHKSWPDIVRRSWDTARVIAGEKQQKGILGFLKKRADPCDSKAQSP